MSGQGPRREVPASASFHAVDGVLHCDEVDLRAIAAAHGTPTYVYSADAIARAYALVDDALAGLEHTVCFAVKACSNLAVLAHLGRLGAGADVVSGGELARALRAGIPPERIVFSGVGKSDEELRYAVREGIRSIHVESEPELEVLGRIAAELRAQVPIALRINPDVDAATHPYIATGIHGTKFGLELDRARALVPRILESEYFALHGIACHIGSQLGAAEPLAEAVFRTASFARECVDLGAPVTTVDCGGGWPVTYGDEADSPAPWSAFGEAIVRGLAHARLEWAHVVIEPGRALVADAGVVLSRVLYVKQQGGKRFVILDAAMTELIRPALYDAYHAIVPVVASSAPLVNADFVGPVCETGDFLALDRAFPGDVKRGDLVAIRTAGAYGAVMGSRYNTRPLAAEVLVESDAFRVIRARETIEDVLRLELA